MKRIEKFYSDRYHVINLEKETDAIFADRLRKSLCLDECR